MALLGLQLQRILVGASGSGRLKAVSHRGLRLSLHHIQEDLLERGVWLGQ